MGNHASGSLSIGRILRDGITYMPATVLPTLFSIVAVSIYTRQFSVAQYGMYNFVLSVTTPVALLTTEWAAQPIGRFYAEYDERGELETYRRGVMQFIVLIMIGLLIVSMIVAILLSRLSHMNVFQYIWIVASVVTLCPFVLMSRILPSSLQSTRYQRVTVLVTGMSVAVSLTLVQILGRDITWLFCGQATANSLAIPFLLRWNRLPLGISGVLRWSPEWKLLLRKFAVYGLPMVLWFLAGNLLDDEDRWILLWFRGPSEVGIYSVNYNLISAVGNAISVPVITAIGPILFRQWSLKRYDEVRHTIAGMTELYAGLAAMVLGGTIVVGSDVVHLFLGRDFWPGSSILLPVLIGRMLWGSASIGHRTMELSERTLAMGLSGIVAAVVNLCLNVILVPRSGYHGAALATCVSYAVYAVIIRWQSRYSVEWILNYRYILIYLGTSVPLAILIRLTVMRWLAMSPTIVHVVAGLVAFIGSYVLLIGLMLRQRVSSLLRNRHVEPEVPRSPIYTA